MEIEPNKKAEYLVLDFYHSLEHTISDSYSKFTWQICCNCATQIANKMIEEIEKFPGNFEKELKYWQEVKREIDSLREECNIKAHIESLLDGISCNGCDFFNKLTKKCFHKKCKEHEEAKDALIKIHIKQGKPFNWQWIKNVDNCFVCDDYSPLQKNNIEK